MACPAFSSTWGLTSSRAQHATEISSIGPPRSPPPRPETDGNGCFDTVARGNLALESRVLRARLASVSPCSRIRTPLPQEPQALWGLLPYVTGRHSRDSVMHYRGGSSRLTGPRAPRTLRSLPALHALEGNAGIQHSLSGCVRRNPPRTAEAFRCTRRVLQSGRRAPLPQTPGRGKTGTVGATTDASADSSTDHAQRSAVGGERGEEGPAGLDQVAASARAATEVEEREATQLLRAAERALGLLQKAAAGAGAAAQGKGEGQGQVWGQWGKWGRWGRWGWPSKEEEEEDVASAGASLETAGTAGLWGEGQKADIVHAMSSGAVGDAQELLSLCAHKAQEFAAEAAALPAGTSTGAPAQAAMTSSDVLWLLEVALSVRNASLARSIVDACRHSRAPSPSGGGGRVPGPGAGPRASGSAGTGSTGSGPSLQRSGSSGSLNGSTAQMALQWPPVDTIGLYSAFIPGLAALLRVADAVVAVQEVRRRGLPAGDEVPFGHVVGCPTCRRPLAVVQPQYGRQVVPCSQCRYEFELVSGDLVSCDSESLLEGPSPWERALRLLRLKRDGIPTAVHSTVMKLPDGTSEIRTFATATPSVPAQEGERISLACAAPSDARRPIGILSTLRLRGPARVPGWRAGEPMQLDNHSTGQVLPLLRAPPKSQRGFQAPSWLLPGALFLTANATAGAAIVDPSLPGLIATVALSSAAAGTALTTFVAPRLNRLPESSVAAMSIRQQLLKQYSELEGRLDQLSRAAADEVRMLARMCQLQNKMEAVGEPRTYSARLERVVAARDGLRQRLQARLQLIDSYAKIAAMIEIEVEMESDVPSAEAAGAVASIADQIERLMEVESLQKEWRIQAEANDDVERLLRSAPPLPEI